MNYIFWICWSAEILLVIAWIFSELKLKHLSPNPYSFLSLLYLIGVFLLRQGAGFERTTNFMVMIPAIPLVCMLLFVVIHTISGGKWN